MRRFIINNFFEDEEDYKDWLLEYKMDILFPIMFALLLFSILINL